MTPVEPFTEHAARAQGDQASAMVTTHILDNGIIMKTNNVAVIVNDHRPFRETLVLHVRGLLPQHQMVILQSAEDACTEERIDNPPSLVFLHMRAAQPDCIEAARSLRAAFPHTPLINISRPDHQGLLSASVCEAGAMAAPGPLLPLSQCVAQIVAQEG